MGQLTPNERAYELLRWQALAPLADYSDDVDYFSIWKQASDKALDQWDKDHPSSTSSELEAFRELERMGHFNQNDYYSPSKAANGFYCKTLRGFADGSVEPSGRIRRAEASRKIRNQVLRPTGKAPKTS